LGIKELIATGTSHFAGSIPTRIYNVNLAASRINGTLIAPNEIFSFNNTVGDISSLSGYKQAYVIQNGQTVLGDGGGVCQVSTTIFRAALASGLPIVERHAHAYRVHYYEEDSPPGLDATIYTPSVDLKFRNDTGNYILIQTQIDLNKLVLTFNFYGVKDGRQVNITKPTLWGYQKAPEDQYIDDPTLPVGTVKQIDFAATGIKSQFDYTVTKNGEVINHQVFYSDFKPWQAKYLRGTKI
jgi:vancomycin resistance protein YoaR